MFHNQEIAPLRMLHPELSLSCQDMCRNRSAFLEISYCLGTTAQFHNHETAPLRMRQTELSLSLKVRCCIAVLSWNKFYCQGTTALFYNQETAHLRMLQTELSLFWQDMGCNRSAFLEQIRLPGDYSSVP
jgi:hypothetical protein